MQIRAEVAKLARPLESLPLILQLLDGFRHRREILGGEPGEAVAGVQRSGGQRQQNRAA